MEIPWVLLDKTAASVVKYSGIQYRDERKEYRSRQPFREPGPLAGSPGRGERGKVRPGANPCPKVINESGTAANTASCTDVWYKRYFYL